MGSRSCIWRGTTVLTLVKRVWKRGLRVVGGWSSVGGCRLRGRGAGWDLRRGVERGGRGDGGWGWGMMIMWGSSVVRTGKVGGVCIDNRIDINHRC